MNLIQSRLSNSPEVYPLISESPQSFAKIFARHGHPVALLSRTQSKLDDLAKHVTDEFGSPAKGVSLFCTHFSSLDNQRFTFSPLSPLRFLEQYAVSASDADALSKVFELIKKDLGTPVIGIHNAATISFGNFRDLKVEQLDEAYQTQVRGGFLFSQEMLKSIESLPEFSSKEHNSNPAGALFFTVSRKFFSPSVFYFFFHSHLLVF